jgi:DNA-directed RNA polymerase subunit alpha
MLESQVYQGGVPAPPPAEQPSYEPQIEVEESREDFARVVAAPLLSGFGITLGNALRRVLLSSLSGAAVTSVRIDGVQHEFSTIPNVKEDVIEFLLNVKELRLRAASDRPGTLVLDVSGRDGEITAADLQVPEHYEVVNPDLHLATMDSPKGQLRVELNVEPGRGYVPAGQADGLALGVIPMDAMFSPVRKVNYKVGRTRVGQEANYDRLEIEIWTDGTISAVDAVSDSAEIIIEQFKLFAHMGQPPLPVVERGLGAGVVLTPEKYNMPIEDLNLSMRAYNCLRRSGLMTVGQVLENSEEELLSLRNFGRKSYDELKDKLNEMDLLPVEQPEEVMEAPPLEEGEGPVLAPRPTEAAAEAAPAVTEAQEAVEEAKEVPEEAAAPAKKRAKAAKAGPAAEAEAEDEEIPDWKRKLMEITGEEGGE